MIVGVPVGAQVAWLLWKSKGWPLDVTRVVPVIHWAVTHGPFAAGGGGSAQPVITQGADCVTVGWLLTLTRGLGAVARAGPAWEQFTVELVSSRKPGMRSPSRDR
jgi:hypothetical protein